MYRNCLVFSWQFSALRSCLVEFLCPSDECKWKLYACISRIARTDSQLNKISWKVNSFLPDERHNKLSTIQFSKLCPEQVFVGTHAVHCTIVPFSLIYSSSVQFLYFIIIINPENIQLDANFRCTSLSHGSFWTTLGLITNYSEIQQLVVYLVAQYPVTQWSIEFIFVVNIWTQFSYIHSIAAAIFMSNE